MQENDIVRINYPSSPRHNQSGTIVFEYNNGERFEIEFGNGRTECFHKDFVILEQRMKNTKEKIIDQLEIMINALETMKALLK